MIRAAIFIAVATCVLHWAPPTALGGARVVTERDGGLSVEVTFDEFAHTPEAGALNLPGHPKIHYVRFHVALPRTGDFHVRSTGGSFTDDGDLPELGDDDARWPASLRPALDAGFYPPESFSVSGPFTFRKTRVIAVNCYASQVDVARAIHRRWSGYRIEVSYEPTGRDNAVRPVDPMVASLVINPEVVARTARRAPVMSAVPDPHFALSPQGNWVKILVNERGIYEVLGSDLSAQGVSLGSIADPSSFRLFTAGGREQERLDSSGVPFQDADGTWQVGKWMKECDVLVEYGGDGSFDPTDRIIFYGLGASGWEDLYEPGRSRSDYFVHSRARGNFYYLTWDDVPGFPDPPGPGRMVPTAAAPSADPNLTTFEERLYFEKNLVKEFRFGGDGWLWLDIGRRENSQTISFETFNVSDLDPGQDQRFETIAMSKFCNDDECRLPPPGFNVNHHAQYEINGVVIGEAMWDTPANGTFADARDVAIPGRFLREGSNRLRLVIPRTINSKDFMYFAWYKVFYHRLLRAANESLFFSSPDTTGAVNFLVTNLPSSGTLRLFDVTDPYHPLVLNGFETTTAGTTRNVRFSSNISGDHRYYWVGTANQLKRPANVARHFPTDLRDVVESPDMIIVTDRQLQNAADALRVHREDHFPYPGTPEIKIVTAEEIFDNFSGGQPDAMAVRNYFKFLYDNFTDGDGAPVLKFVLLLGDANTDFKDFSLSGQRDLVTTNLMLNNLETPYEAYATDDWFVLLDPSDTPAAGLPDVAIGRLAAATPSEASFLVNKTIDYELNAEFGTWRDRVILLADDEISPSYKGQRDFVDQSEQLAHFCPGGSCYVAPFLERHKIYLTEFPAIVNIKPTSRISFIKAWNDGALIINYIGHGSSVQIADEQVFVASDVSELRNGRRLPMFIAVSCTIGDFASSTGKSLSERLMLKDGGGVIATVTASQVTFINPNFLIDRGIYTNMFPVPQQPGNSTPIGVAVMASKNEALALSPSTVSEQNFQKYNLLGDPAMRLLAPTRGIEFSAVDTDSITTGKPARIRGTVLAGGTVDRGFNGTVVLTAREPDRQVHYEIPINDTISQFMDYRYPGGTFYEGTADVSRGRFEFNITVPRFSANGRYGFLRAYADNGAADAVALDDDVFFKRPPQGETSEPVDGPPSVTLGFEGGLNKVTTGAVLNARVEDGDGINTLNSTPEGKLALVYDDTNLPIDVTEFFQYDHGGVNTAGNLAYPLPELSVGEHRVILKVADTFGQIRLDTLSFTFTEQLDFSGEIVFNYPNPFEEETHFLLKDLTHRARITIDIFTVSGRKVRRINTTRDAGGEVWIRWDGRDASGGSIANGTYLYVARIDFEASDRPPLIQRGKMVKIR